MNIHIDWKLSMEVHINILKPKFVYLNRRLCYKLIYYRDTWMYAEQKINSQRYIFNRNQVISIYPIEFSHCVYKERGVQFYIIARLP